ncbi:phosphotransferase family protein [Tianweitania sp. BSSL-BM11]|uniref:Phosphotransferase family protein n=1 Tax=Tianweitania aestuarii TaxID=2814886 RepID=A0ABS5RX02_9HYPH|nr:phosphotransferase family protein [Tianweitania aestuarii]MBS9721310.1 phosphotransferase family protein [Tianweitania aestuarii]
MAADLKQSGGQGELALSTLSDYLKTRLPDLRGEPRLQQISGGQSNPTFFLSFPDRELVLRKQPAGELLPSAHAVDREYRIMAALADHGVPVPRMVLYEDDPALLGTKFYVMERLDGRVFHDSQLPELAKDERASAYRDLATVLARLHSVDVAAAGLSDFGKHGSYFARQIARWTKQWHLSQTREIPDIDALAAWLPQNIPADDRTTIVHGDYRVGNVMLHPTAPQIVGVLDWELATLGHPFADLAHTETLWFITPQEYGGVMGVDFADQGLPTREAFEEIYLGAVGLSEGLKPFHLAFALFRFAVIFEGIAARARDGSAASANAAEVGKLSSVLAGRAVGILSGDRGWKG